MEKYETEGAEAVEVFGTGIEGMMITYIYCYEDWWVFSKDVSADNAERKEHFVHLLIPKIGYESWISKRILGTRNVKRWPKKIGPLPEHWDHNCKKGTCVLRLSALLLFLHKKGGHQKLLKCLETHRKALKIPEKFPENEKLAPFIGKRKTVKKKKSSKWGKLASNCPWNEDNSCAASGFTCLKETCAPWHFKKRRTKWLNN